MNSQCPEIDGAKPSERRHSGLCRLPWALLAICCALATTSPALSDPGDTPAANLPTIEYEFEALQVRGNGGTGIAFFESLLGLEPGDAVTVEQLDRFRRYLLATGYFRSVEARLVEGAHPGTVVLDLTVDELNTLRLADVHLGVSRDTPLWGGIELTEGNLFGTGLVLGGGFVASGDQFAVRARLADPFGVSGLPFGWRADGILSSAAWEGPGLSVTPDEDDLIGFELTRAGGRLGLMFRPWSSFGFGAGYRLEYVDLAFVEPALELPDLGISPGNSWLSNVYLHFVLSTLSDPDLPIRGYRFSLDIEGSTGGLGSDFDYLRPVAGVEVAIPLGREHALRFELLAGGLLGADNAPYFEGFYIGDMAHLVPERDIELQFTDRRSVDVLGTNAQLATYGDVFARLYTEWAIPIERTLGARVELYIGAGLLGIQQGPWALGRDVGAFDATAADIGFHTDLTFDLGVRADTVFGLVRFSLGSALALVPLN